ncbi:MAG: hypothetical protein IT458_08400 [Planctomycetes bacterium]|nr:hypothetical protein [Planctomycetota bacterium]
MTLWRKQAVDYWSHPKILAAGKDGGIAFEAVLGLNAQLARDGTLLARDARHEALLAKATILSLRALGRGLDRCVAAGLLERTADGGLRILGWDDEWRPRPTATRVIEQSADVPIDATCVPCTRCGRIKVADEYRQCPDCRDYDRSRRAARMPQENRSGTGAETAAVPVRIAAALPHQNRSGSAVRNGTGTERRYPEREKREDQKRQELPESSSSEKPLSSENQNGGTASSTKGARAFSALRIVRDLAAKLTDSEPDSRADRSGFASDPRPILAPNAKETGRWCDR